jgi:hypothetical protein
MSNVTVKVYIKNSVVSLDTRYGQILIIYNYPFNNQICLIFDNKTHIFTNGISLLYFLNGKIDLNNINTVSYIDNFDYEEFKKDIMKFGRSY